MSSLNHGSVIVRLIGIMLLQGGAGVSFVGNFSYFRNQRRRSRCCSATENPFILLDLFMKSSFINRHSSIMETTPIFVGKLYVLYPPKKNL